MFLVSLLLAWCLGSIIVLNYLYLTFYQTFELQDPERSFLCLNNSVCDSISLWECPKSCNFNHMPLLGLQFQFDFRYLMR